MLRSNRFPQIRGRIRLRARLSQVRRAIMTCLSPSWQDRQKLTAELDFWINHWDVKLRRGQFWNEDIETLLRQAGEWPAVTQYDRIDYDTIRWLEARAHGLRILKEAGIDDNDFFAGKTVVDIGPGAVCFLEASDARLGVAIEPLALEFAENNLLLPSDHVFYLPIAAENLPLLDSSVDIVVSRNNLDHVTDPALVVAEVFRILRPGGSFVLIVHLEPQASITEPHALSRGDIHSLTQSFLTHREVLHKGGRTATAETLAGVYEKPFPQ